VIGVELVVPAIEVLVVDDDELVRAGISLLLGSAGDLRVVGEAADGEQAVALARRLRPQVILMDLFMPVLDGIQALQRLVDEHSTARVLVFTSSREKSRLADAFAAGAVGYLVKNCNPQDLVDAVRAAARASV
jgi:DNA-binding NarL/FixJ family response regulator